MDKTVSVARGLNLRELVHDKNYGYGANQKACYREALRAGADVIVMVHTDYQFILDQEIIAQMVCASFKIRDVPVPARYFPEASSASFFRSVVYGLGIIWLLFRFLLHRDRLVRQRQFDRLKSRYREADA